MNKLGMVLELKVGMKYRVVKLQKGKGFGSWALWSFQREVLD